MLQFKNRFALAQWSTHTFVKWCFSSSYKWYSEKFCGIYISSKLMEWATSKMLPRLLANEHARWWWFLLHLWKKLAERTVSEINTNCFFLCWGQVDAKYPPCKLKGESCQSSFGLFVATQPGDTDFSHHYAKCSWTQDNQRKTQVWLSDYI